MVGVVLLIMRHQLLVRLVFRNEVTEDELDQSTGVRVLLELKVDPVVHFNDSKALLVCVVFHNQLLQVQEGSLMFDALSDLNLRDPSMWSEGCLAVVALLVVHHEFYSELLLEHSVRMDFLLHSQFHFDTP